MKIRGKLLILSVSWGWILSATASALPAGFLPALMGDGVHDDTAAIQARLDAGLSCVYLPPPKKWYLISKTLKIGSDSELRLDRFSVIRLAPKSDCPMIENQHYRAGKDVRVALTGGIWDMANVDQAPNAMAWRWYKPPQPDRVPKTHVYEHFWGMAMRFCNVENITVKGLTVRNPTTYGMAFGKMNYFLIDDITFDYTTSNPFPGNMDGVHLDGHSHFGRISNLRGTCYDDMVALNADDGACSTEFGPITDITIDGLYCDYCHSAVISLPKTWGAGETIPSRIWVQGLSHSDTSRDVSLRLTGSIQGMTCADTVNLTVVQIITEINNSATTDDDVVCRYSVNPSERPTVPCKIKVEGFPVEALSVTLTGDKLRFPAIGDISKMLTLPSDGTWVSFTISGQTASAVMGDARIDVRINSANGDILATKFATILWVDNITLRAEQDSNFSMDNASLLKPNPPKLGKQQILSYPTYPSLSVVIEFQGNVFPASFTKPIDWARDCVDDYAAILTPSNTFYSSNIHLGIARQLPLGNDPPPEEIQSKTPSETGKIYDIDTPGFQVGDGGTAIGLPAEYLVLVRYNFFQYARFNGIRCSDDFSWFARVTGKKTEPAGISAFIHYDRNNHPQDNAVGSGSTSME